MLLAQYCLCDLCGTVIQTLLIDKISQKVVYTPYYYYYYYYVTTFVSGSVLMCTV